MKRLILGGIILLTSSSLLFGYTVISKKIDGGDITYLIKCSDGNTVAFNKRISDGAYFIYNNIVYSMDKAVQIGCKKTKKSVNSYITIKKNGLIFKKRSGKKGIEYYLKDESSYAYAELKAAMGDKTVHKINRDVKVKKLKYYRKNKTIMDSYYKIIDGDKYIFYVRKSDIR